MAYDLVNARTSERVRARWTTYLLLGCLALDVIAVASGLAQRALLSRVAAGENVSAAAADANDARQSTIGIAQVVAFIVTAIVWLVWLKRAYANLGSVGTKQSRFTPGWAVGYWFVPFVNLVRPYQIVRDLWLRSDTLNTAESVASLPSPAVVALWWGVYLGSGFAGRAYASLARDAQSLDELLTVTNVGIGVDALGIVAALLAISVVRGIDQRQQRFEDPLPEVTTP